MEREIKFRAWHRELKKMLPVVIIDFRAEAVYVHDDQVYNRGTKAQFAKQYLDKWSFEHIDLLEFTGRKDRDDKDIYDGDRIRGNNKMMLEAISVGDIEWDAAYLCWSMRHDCTDQLLRIYDMDSIEVIGEAKAGG